MKKNFRQKTTWLIILLFSGAALFGWNTSLYQALRGAALAIPLAYAKDDDDEDEYEDERDDEGEYEASLTSTKTTKVKTTPTYKTVLVTKVITTLDPKFTTDQDGDRIVDGLDPHPSVDEREYFTDADDDGIANAFDRHPDEDDFAYYEEENDENGDGVLDSYEFMAERGT